MHNPKLQPHSIIQVFLYSFTQVFISPLNLSLNLNLISFVLLFVLIQKVTKKSSQRQGSCRRGFTPFLIFYVLILIYRGRHRLSCLTFCLDAKSNKKIKAPTQAVATKHNRIYGILNQSGIHWEWHHSAFRLQALFLFEVVYLTPLVRGKLILPNRIPRNLYQR